MSVETGVPPAGPSGRDGGPKRERPKPFAEDWSIAGTPTPPTTIPNPLGAAARPVTGALQPRSVGPRFRRYTVEQIAGAPNVDFYWGVNGDAIDLSPDGSEVAFSWSRTGAFEVYAAPIAGDRIIQLTGAGRRSVAPKWSPDAKWVAFMRDTDGDENMQLWLVDRDGTHERALTDDRSVMHRDHEWSPDGTRLAYVANAGGAFAVHVIDVATGERRRLTDGREDDHYPQWSPDGKWILYWSRREPVRTNSDLFVIASGGGEARKLETRDGQDGESKEGRWSPDGTQVAFTTNVRGRYETALARLEGGAVALVEHFGATPFDDDDPAWRPDGRGLVYRRSRDSSVAIRRIFTISRADEAVADVPGVHYSPAVGPDSETVVAVFSEARRPADVVVRPRRAVETRRITSSLPADIDAEVLVEPHHVRYPGAGGTPIPALLYIPHVEAIAGPPGRMDGSSTPPGVLYVHGGPTGQHFRQWDPIAQILANHGYVVLAPNIRGSTGYGRDFQEGNRRDWGGKDLEDVVRGAEWLEREGIADGRRIGIRGGSYGGYMTLMCMAMAPGRWAAGVSVVGVVNWATMYGTTRGDLQHYLVREFGDPERDAARYRDRSPLTHASKISAPLLIIQGARDPRVPLHEAEQIVEALKANGRTYGYQVYPDEGHAFAKTANKIDMQTRALEWFETHLKRTSAASAPAPSGASRSKRRRSRA